MPFPTPLIQHPAGVILPWDHESQRGVIPPELRVPISNGSYCAEMIARLPEALKRRDRVLVVGTALGLLTTLVAKSGLADQVIAVEADAGLVSYLETVHALNGVSWIEALNAFPAVATRGRIPYFTRHDPRDSSLRPEEGHWRRVSLAPMIDLRLVLADAGITMIVWDGPVSAAHLLTEADLGPVERILVRADERVTDTCMMDRAWTPLRRRGFTTSDPGPAYLLRRTR